MVCDFFNVRWLVIGQRTAYRAARDKDIDEEGSDDEDEEEEEEEDEDEDGDGDGDLASKSGQPEMSRAERKAAKKLADQKKKGAAEDDSDDSDEEDADLINPNHSSAKTKKLSDLNAPQPLSRRER